MHLQTDPSASRIAWFISPHGFGHAARAASIMAALQEIDPGMRFEVFTRVPAWFFHNSLAQPFGYHDVLTDIGLVQSTALSADLPATVRRLDGFLPFDQALVDDLARQVRTLHCALVVCDIAPLGIAVAKEAGLPSVLIENFTWDWIYHEYVADHPDLQKYIAYLHEWFARADFHLQTEPVCQPGAADLTTRPVSRTPRTPAHLIRDRLSLPLDAKAVLITMGGIADQVQCLDRLTQHRTVYFVIPGAASTSVQKRDNLVLLPHNHDLFHPDLVRACDAVVGKAGYSTLAEVFHAGVPFGYISRPAFRESAVLAAYIDRQMPSMAIPPEQFHTGDWLSRLPELLALPHARRRVPNGAEQAARFIQRLLRGQITP
jgi:hypothetical protein